ncbi:hypothetical protein LCGC14_1567130 [marine sediment metagenome]|uniref:Uncharacterized protein n=1 Tax=marine sediment metagenome TaxID=412755 RepID=A0A0F9LLA9_9ZZZZ
MATFDNTLFENTNMTLKVVNLRNTLTKALVTGATVTVRVLDSAGVVVVGTTDPIPVVEQAAPQKGLYHAPLDDTASLATGATGTLEYVADAGAGFHREWVETYIVKDELT